MRIYKLKVCMKRVIERLQRFKLETFNEEYPIIFIEANDPDDACYKTMTQLFSIILKQDNSTETSLLLKDAAYDIFIVKIYNDEES